MPSGSRLRVRAMLAAYRRTLAKTMQQSRSMNQVVQQAGLPWLKSPDQAVVWAVALGLAPDVERVLKRSAEDLASGTAPRGTYLPVWYATDGTSLSAEGGPGGDPAGVPED